MKSIKSLGGFTLLEITLVIAIIGIFATVAMSSFGEVRAQSRDKARMASLQQLQVALELYKDKNGVYPQRGCDTSVGWNGPGTHPTAWGNDANDPDCTEYILGLVPDFISELPTDPKFEMEDGRGFMYRVSNDLLSYKVMAHAVAEVLTVTDFNHEFVRCPKDFGLSYCGAIPQASVYAVYGGAIDSATGDFISASW